MGSLGTIEKLVVFFAAAAIAVYAMVKLRLWQADLSILFLRSGRWEELIIIYAIVFVFATVITKLVQIAFRTEFRRR